jgi:3-methylcrotonyl-CoA carboxylase alpha subunit
MFSKILIANRGEIACRIIETCHRLGVMTVVVHSDADATARHVAIADQAVRLGPPEAAHSYLDGAAIIEAARQCGAEAIHPGYGFLSENPEFVEAVEQAGIVFVGPSSSAIRAMGLKDAAKRLMEQAGVPVVPGYHGEAQETVVLAGKANEIGYPVLIKARAGGGGKGMRRVDSAGEFRDALASARREAKSAFGDERVLVEKYIEKPRHIEVQVFGDNHGNVVHLFERDCSLQRRHQKVIEEAPAPGMNDAMRAAMCKAAVRAAKAIDYSGAGTVEFIVDAARGLRPDRFWFMEMNTRLQVEHPVTEMITGVDLVEWQLRVASGGKLPRRQNEIALSGHAFEARIYAEDAGRGFLPATGKLHHLRFPDAARVETGVVAGDTISPYYDPMIAKLIVHADNRRAALSRLRSALGATEIAGTVTNLGFLLALACQDGIAAGEVDTGLIERNLDILVARPETPDFLRAVAALCGLGLADAPPVGAPFSRLGGFSLWGSRQSFCDLSIDGEIITAIVTQISSNGWQVALPGGIAALTVVSRGPGRMKIVTQAGRHTISVAVWPDHVTLFHDGLAHDFELVDPFAVSAGDAESGNVVTAPMSGLVKVLNVRAGDAVRKGMSLVVLEAMKMEHSLIAHRDAVVARVLVGENTQVADGAVLMELEAEAEAEQS